MAMEIENLVTMEVPDQNQKSMEEEKVQWLPIQLSCPTCPNVMTSYHDFILHAKHVNSHWAISSG